MRSFFFSDVRRTIDAKGKETVSQYLSLSNTLLFSRTMSSYELVFQISLLTAALLCTLVFGFALIFAIVIMPGLALLDDGGFLHAFQVIDGIIQRNQPIFVVTWIGSTISLVVAMVMCFRVLNATQAALLAVAAVLDIAAQVATITINIPLNNRVKNLNVLYMDLDMKKLERDHFESTWNKWNIIRTVAFGFVSVYLLVLLLLTNAVF